MSLQQSGASTLHARCIKWNAIGKRSANGGMFPFWRTVHKKKANRAIDRMMTLEALRDMAPAVDSGVNVQADRNRDRRLSSLLSLFDWE